ncbi:MAG: signal recognition particle-docking protein FtsY [Synergistes sp.]|nr:signal recognition particle-docking protein FtsY [Synergistes sp.]
MGLFSNFAAKLRSAGNRWTQSVSSIFSDDPVTDDFWDELEENLILGDVGVDTAEELITELKKIMIDRRITTRRELKSVFAELLVSRLEAVPGMGEPLRLSSKPSVIIMIGVNGSGKTTTSGKFASQLKADGKNVIMAAADTFRAAAIDQLKAWGERAGVRVIAQAPESDPAAVVYDSLMAAKASGADVIIADTAGRLHTKSNLMDELAKIMRVIKREIPEGASEVLIVLDAVTGQNGFIQAETFAKVMPITGVVLTKFDNTSKGGIVIAIAEKLKMPVRYVGLGEGIDDLQLFEPRAFVEALLNADSE